MTKTRVKVPGRSRSNKQEDSTMPSGKPGSWDDFFASKGQVPPDFHMPRKDTLPQKRKLFK